MKVRCRHCGSLNPTELVDVDGNGTCAVCRRPLGLDGEIEAVDKDGSPSEILSSGSTFDPIDWSRETYDIKQEYSGTGEQESGSRELLGSLPTDDEAIDISELLEGTSANLDPDETRPELGEAVITTFPANDTSDGVDSGWRIKNPRGVVYEMGSAADVVSWLAEQTDLTAIKVSRGAGRFRPASDFSELAHVPYVSGTEPTGSLDGSIGGESSSDISELLVDMTPGAFIDERKPSTSQAPAGSGLELDFTRASDRHGSGASLASRATAGSVGAEQASAILDDGSAYGFRALLLILLVLFAAAHFILNSSAGTQPVEEAITVTSPPGPRLQSAIRLLDERKYTAATRVLERLAERSEDPRVYRYLATAFYKTDRIQEAKVALETYRKRQSSRRKTK